MIRIQIDELLRERRRSFYWLAKETGGRVEYPLENIYKDVAGYLQQPSDEGNFVYKVGTGGYESANVVRMTQTAGAEAPRFLPLAENIRRELNLLLQDLNVAWAAAQERAQQTEHQLTAIRDQVSQLTSQLVKTQNALSDATTRASDTDRSRRCR